MATTVTLVIVSVTHNADSVAVRVSRSDTGAYSNLALDSAATDDDITAAVQALALSLANQDDLIAQVIGQEYSATATGPSGNHTATIQVIAGASNSDSLAITYRNVATGDITNYPADVTSTLDSLTAALTAVALAIAQAAQDIADANAGLVGTAISQTSNV